MISAETIASAARVAETISKIGATIEEVSRALEVWAPALRRFHSRMVRNASRDAWRLRRQLGWRRHLCPSWWEAVRFVRMLRGT